MKTNGVSCFDDYFDLLVGADCEQEWNALYEVVTTHHTHWFRDYNQWHWFEHRFLVDLHEQFKQGKREGKLKIWSAACSTGEEAYSFACCIANVIPKPQSWEFDILATDIAVDTLAIAERGSYDERGMNPVPEEIKGRFFTADDVRGWMVIPMFQEWTRF